jgi:tetratricopeptide (TPR) repeat protein
MEVQEQPLNEEQKTRSKQELDSKRETKKPKNEKFKWWQTLLILTMTLVISVGAAYYVSQKYLWSNYDNDQLKQKLEAAKTTVDSKPNDPKSHVSLGYAYFLNGDNDEAIKEYKLAIDLDKNYFDAYFNLGLVYNKENRLNDSVKMAQKASEISPRDYKGFLLKGMSYRKLKMYSDAMEALNQANKLMPANTDIMYEIGMVAEAQGDKKNAEQIYKDALSYDPMYKPALQGLERLAKK